jgi:short-subunit dehydrogenase involved in D-alanine esterification of teichoic acids
MSSRIQTILILGATGGIGEALARKFHAQGKKVIVTGRREHKLQRLAQDLPGLETRVVRNPDLTLHLIPALTTRDSGISPIFRN